MLRSCSGKPQRKSVANRATSILGWGRIMRFGAARVAWKSCRAAAGAAINVACAALLASTPPHPDLLLTTARICLQLRRPRRAYDAVAGVNVVDVRTAERMMKLAAALCTRGLRAEAKDVLRRAIALAPHAATPRSALNLVVGGEPSSRGRQHVVGAVGGTRGPIAKIDDRVATPRRSPACARRLFTTGGSISGRQTAPARVAVPGLRVEAENLLREAVAEEPCRSAPRLALAEFLLENLRYGEAETVAAAAVQRCPTSAELRLVLARIQLQLLRLDDAEKTIEALLAIAPENAWAWFEYGKILQNSHHRSDSVFERAADLSGNDSGLLAGVAQHFLYDLDYEKAAKYYERLLNLHPGMWDNFVICRHYATCLQKIARAQEAAQIIANALESCRRAAERAKSEGLELIKREEALLLLQAGRADEGRKS